MAETVLEIAACGSCGADVRDESVFCYNCGERINTATAKDGSAIESVAEPVAAPVAAQSEKPSHVVSRPPLKSAASLRQQRRAFNRQPVEVSWEPPARPPLAFVVTTIVLAVGALVLLILALYLR